MALNIFLPTQNGQGINLQLGDTNGDGKFDFGLGVRQYQGYGNGWGGAYNAGEIGFNTGRGGYLDNYNGSYNGFASQNNYTGWDTNGTTRGSSTYADVFGNYNNNRFANDVWGNYYQGNTQANMWGYQDSNVGGNVWSGANQWNYQAGNVFGGGGFASGGWFGF